MILDFVESPDDLKLLSVGHLSTLCRQIRELIIETMSKNGGHLAPSLGVVELAVALHYVFESPKDKIIWDVGHQAAAHKILTGRRGLFHTARREGGISGFPKRDESPHDIFGTGHASTSIAAALGIATAMDMSGEDGKVIAVIGDGSMTGGLAFEAINQTNKSGRLVIVLNDNEMSISPSVGALSKFLSLHAHGKRAGRLKKRLKRLLMRIPIVGRGMWRLVEKAGESTLAFFTPGSLFEAFGCDYIGPVDGHDIAGLVRVFKEVKELEAPERPILVHVITKKGKGYRPAEEDPVIFHGVGPFDRVSGTVYSKSGKTYSGAFSDAMISAASKDDKVVAITAAMKTGTGLEEFSRLYPKNMFDVGIAEGYAVTFAAGLAVCGFRPVVTIYSTFLQRAFDNIIHDVAIQRLGVVFAIDRAGLVGEDGPTHHGLFDIAYMSMVPNMTVMAPRDEKTMEKMLAFALSSGLPASIRYPRGAIPKLFSSIPCGEMELGRGEILFESPSPLVSIWGVGHLLAEVIEAAERLEKMGIGVVVVDPRFLKPLDTRLLAEMASSCPYIVTVEEGVMSGGFGSIVSRHLLETGYKGRFSMIALPDLFVEHGSQSYLRKRYSLDADGITEGVKRFVSEERYRPTLDLMASQGI